MVDSSQRRSPRLRGSTMRVFSQPRVSCPNITTAKQWQCYRRFCVDPAYTTRLSSAGISLAKASWASSCSTRHVKKVCQLIFTPQRGTISVNTFCMVHVERLSGTSCSLVDRSKQAAGWIRPFCKPPVDLLLPVTVCSHLTEQRRC